MVEFAKNSIDPLGFSDNLTRCGDWPFGNSIWHPFSQQKEGVLECYGGLVEWLLSLTPVDASAMTLGHVIWGRSQRALDFCREHELVHVRQYERWGPLFLPLYFIFSLTMWFRGKHPYYDNPFEREAFGEDHPRYRAKTPNQ